MKSRSFLVAFLVGLSLQHSFAFDYRVDLTRSLDWRTMALEATATLNLASAGLKLPAGRTEAEELIDMDFPRLMRPTLLALPIDSSNILESFIDNGTLTLAEVGSIAGGADQAPTALSTDLRELSAPFSINLHTLAEKLILHRRAAEPPRVIEKRATRPYTGIIIYANDTLPVHGRTINAQATACFFPKIWDSEMTLIYERNMADPEIAREKGIVRYADAQEAEAGLFERIGKEPLRILARSLFGVRVTDPIIDRDDALKIISSEENRKLLKEGRVVIVLADEALRALP